jgi:two-component system chemotaxis response regulator CheY
MGKNVLIVDDSGVMRAMILKALRMTDLELGHVYEAGDGQQGLDALAEHSVDLAIVDINMPVMGGHEMIGRMKAAPKLAQIPILVISTEASETRIERLEEMGVRCIPKPFTPETLQRLVHEMAR